MSSDLRLQDIERLRAAGYEVTGKDGWFNARNAIIEECAKVADSFEDKISCDDDTVVRIAAAIRALKDKP